MEKYPEELCVKMREIFKCVLKRIVDTGKTEESDVLFCIYTKLNLNRIRQRSD